MASTMPLRTERGSPTFSSTDPRELALYFRELELLFVKHTTGTSTDQEKKEWALFYLPVAVMDDWEMLPEYKALNKTWDDFKQAVEQLYPGSQAADRYTRADLDNHVARWRANGIATLGDWASFYRTFQAISGWLIAKGRLSQYDQSGRALRVLSPPVHAQVMQRLMIKEPDHNSDDAYTLEAINQAASYVLRGYSTSVQFPNLQAQPNTMAQPAQPPVQQYQQPAGGMYPFPQQQGAPVQVKQDTDGLMTKLDELTRRIDQLTTRGGGSGSGGNAQGQDGSGGMGRGGTAPRPGGMLSTFTCHYCGRSVMGCPTAQTSPAT